MTYEVPGGTTNFIGLYAVDPAPPSDVEYEVAANWYPATVGLLSPVGLTYLTTTDPFSVPPESNHTVTDLAPVGTATLREPPTVESLTYKALMVPELIVSG